MIRSVVISATILSFVGAASALGFASTAPTGTSITATLEIPTDRLVKIAAAKALWTCEDATCTATLNRAPVSLKTCQQVVKSVGAVEAFSSDQKSLSAKALKKCNAVAKS